MSHRAFPLAPVLLSALFVACLHKEPPPPYLQLKVKSGRIYYADTRHMLQSPTGGFLTFKDMVTAESVRLPEGSYEPVPVPFSEIERARDRYMYNPSQPPHVDNTPKPRDGGG